MQHTRAQWHYDVRLLSQSVHIMGLQNTIQALGLNYQNIFMITEVLQKQYRDNFPNLRCWQGHSILEKNNVAGYAISVSNFPGIISGLNPTLAWHTFHMLQTNLSSSVISLSARKSKVKFNTTKYNIKFKMKFKKYITNSKQFRTG